MYSAWVKIDESLPWIELKGAFQTKNGAREAAKEKLGKTKVKIVKLSPRKKPLKAAITVNP
jgi:hypothetical protein